MAWVDCHIVCGVFRFYRLGDKSLKRYDGMFMCQLRDPFGNLIGLRGTR